MSELALLSICGKDDVDPAQAGRDTPVAGDAGFFGKGRDLVSDRFSRGHHTHLRSMRRRHDVRGDVVLARTCDACLWY